jgi:hypothetical protein
MIYLVGADDKITLEVTASPATPLSYFASYKIFDKIFRRVVELDNVVGTLANTTPVDLVAIGSLENKNIAVDSIQVTNKDASTRTILLKFTDGTTTVDWFRADLTTGQQLLITGDGSAAIRTAAGAL